MGHLPTIEIIGPPGRVVVNECDCDSHISANGGMKKWSFVDPETNKPTKVDPRQKDADESPHGDVAKVAVATPDEV